VLEDLSPDDRAFVLAVSDFVTREVHPAVHALDRGGEYPVALVERMRQLGVFDASSRSLRSYVLVNEEIARGCVSLAPILNAHSSSLFALRHHGSPQQQLDWLPRLASGDSLACLALTEPHSGSDLQSITSRADRVGNGWRVRAHKTFITHGRNAEVMMMLVRTDQQVQPAHKGLSLILLEAGEWEVVRDLPKLGSLSVETCELRVDDVVIPEDRIIGLEPGRGFGQLMDVLETGRLAVAAAAIGAGRAALWNAVEYTKTRQAFGHAVYDFQAVSSELAAVSTELAAAKALVLWAAHKKELGGRRDWETSAAKVFSSETALNAAVRAMKLGGGAGYTEDYDFARLLRDAALYIAGEGANGVLLDLIGRRLSTSQPSIDWI
jgi:alkylation response protein AidB-like acyl-CoA dehydrogenase